MVLRAEPSQSNKTHRHCETKHWIYWEIEAERECVEQRKALEIIHALHSSVDEIAKYLMGNFPHLCRNTSKRLRECSAPGLRSDICRLAADRDARSSLVNEARNSFSRAPFD